MPPLVQASNLIQPIIQRAETSPEQLALVMLAEDGSELQVTASAFHQKAEAYARSLARLGIGPDDLVILVLRHSDTLLYGFWGALYLGAVASIFPFLTEKLDRQIYFERVRTLVAHSRAKAIITFPEFLAPLSDLLAGLDCTVLSTTAVECESAPAALDFTWANPEPEKIAFLQHSSGTTGLQKGVALSHRAVLAQINSYAQAIRLDSTDRIVSWLPLYHDMGLIASFVLPLVTGTPLILMSPFQWVRQPKILFSAIQKYRATLCWLPNFAYNHLARTIRGASDFDLRSIRAWINCSEPVRADSHDLFLQRFTALGVEPQSLAACYAMAENTFAVTQTPTGAPPRIDWVLTRSLQEQRLAQPVAPQSAGATPMVSCGFPIAGVEVKICSANGQDLPERHVGEVCLRSACMLSGYYRRPDLTAEAIRDGWYCTGDMGYLAGGELFISGRKKDLMIIGGKNIYPQDLEAIANQVPGLHPGRNTAFGLPDASVGSEVAVMVCELEDETCSEDERERIETELRQRIIQQNEIALNDVVLVGKQWLIKTSSGKIARSANREKYQREIQMETL